MTEAMYPATREILPGGLAKGDDVDKAAEIAHDYIVKYQGDKTWEVTTRIITKDGFEQFQSFRAKGLTRKEMIRNVVVIRTAALKMNSTSNVFKACFAGKANWSVSKGEDENQKAVYRILLYNPSITNSALRWQTLSVVDSYKNLWDKQSEHLYWARRDKPGTQFRVDLSSMVEAAPAFQGKGWKGLVGPLAGSALGSIPGAGSKISDMLGITSLDDYISQIARVTKELDTGEQMRLWQKSADPSQIRDDDERLPFLQEQHRQLKAAYFGGFSEEMVRRGIAPPHAKDQVVRMKALEAEIAQLESQ